VVRDQVRASAELAEGGQRSCGELRGAGHLCSPSGCCVQCDAACRLAVALPWADPRTAVEMQQLHNVRDMTDPQGRRRGPQLAHGMMTRWNGDVAAPDAARPRTTLPGPGTSPSAEAATSRSAAAAPRRHLQRSAVPDGARDLGRTSNQVWGFTKTNQEWSERLEAALTATRRDDLQHGTNAAYVHGCVCRECRAHQRRRMARNRG
jgi:hypothetical protein